jgi:hypothetical protein
LCLRKIEIPILGLYCAKRTSKDGDEYDGGKILDPQTGKVYKCLLALEEKDKLKVILVFLIIERNIDV